MSDDGFNLKPTPSSALSLKAFGDRHGVSPTAVEKWARKWFVNGMAAWAVKNADGEWEIDPVAGDRLVKQHRSGSGRGGKRKGSGRKKKERVTRHESRGDAKAGEEQGKPSLPVGPLSDSAPPQGTTDTQPRLAPGPRIDPEAGPIFAAAVARREEARAVDGGELPAGVDKVMYAAAVEFIGRVPPHHESFGVEALKAGLSTAMIDLIGKIGTMQRKAAEDAVARGTLIPFADVEEVWEQKVKGAVEVLMALPMRAAEAGCRVCGVGMEHAPQLAAVVEGFVREAIGEIGNLQEVMQCRGSAPGTPARQEGSKAGEGVKLGGAGASGAAVPLPAGRGSVEGGG